jgi:DNA polymerase-3 subunit beta
MKFTVSRDELADKLQTVLSVVSTRTTLPILGNILLKGEGEQLQIAATDLDLSVTCTLAAKVLKGGVTTVPGRTFSDMVRELPEEDVVVSVSGNRMEIKTGRGTYKVSGMPAEEFPKLPTITSAGEITIPGDQLKSMVRRTAYAVSVDPTRPALNGILWQENGKKMHMVATDGHRLARITLQENRLAGHKGDLIIPPKALALVVKILGDSADAVGIALGEKNILFRVGDTLVTTRLIEGPYPNYEQVIPSSNDKRMIVDAAALMAGVRRVAVLSNSLTHQVKFALSTDKLELSAANQDIGGEAKESLPCQYQGEDLEIGYNANYVLDMLKNYEDGDVVFELATSVSAGIVRSAKESKDEDYVCLIMPLRLAE